MRSILGTALFTVLVPGTVAGVAPYFLIRGPQLFAFYFMPLAACGWVLLSAGVAIYLWCAWNFATVGHGTPSPTHPPTELVVRGLYRYSRNPMYVGVCSILLGEALAFGSGNQLLYAIACLIGFHVRVILAEEPVLRRQFGAAYDVYCSQAPRWVLWNNSRGTST